jgi:hypothetical protein
MRIYNVDKNKVLEDLANDCVYAKETEFPYSKDTYFNLGEIGATLKERCIAKIKDENGEETYQDYSGSLSKLFDIKVGSFNSKIDKKDYEEFSKSEVTLLVLDKEEVENLSKDINKILEDNKENIENEKKDKKDMNIFQKLIENNRMKDFKNSLIVDKIEEYYDKAKPIELNDELKEKTRDFCASINNVKEIAKLVHLKDDTGYEYGTHFTGSITQKDKEKEFSLKFIREDGKDKKNIKSDSFLGLRDKLIEFVKENEKNNKEKIQLLEELKEEKIKEPTIETENNFKFSFRKTEEDFYNEILKEIYSLKIEKEEFTGKSYSNIRIEDSNFDKLAFALVDKNTAKAVESINYYENDIRKTYDDDFIKEQNKNIAVLLDDKVKTENLKDIKSGIFNRVAVENYDNFYSLGDELSLSDINELLEKSIDEKFQLRVDNLKNKEEFLIKNANEFNLTLTEDNRILELNSDDENEYKGNIGDFIKGYKGNIKSDFFDKIEEKKEEFLIYREEHIENYVRDEEDIKSAYNTALLNLPYEYNHNHFYDYQEKIMQNQISLSIDEKNIKEIYYDGNKYVSKVLEDSKDLSETVSFDEKTFYKELEKFEFLPYEKFSDNRIEITKEKEENKEKSKNKEKEMEL